MKKNCIHQNINYEFFLKILKNLSIYRPAANSALYIYCTGSIFNVQKIAIFKCQTFCESFCDGE